MSERIELVLPAVIAEKIKKRAEEKKMSIEELFLRAIIKVLEEE